MKKTVYLIDGSSFLYRAFYALKPMVTASGVQVGAVYGFCRMIKKVLDAFNPDHIALVWDSKGKTMRHELYPDYKVTRDAAPMHIFEQKALIQDFARIIHMPQYEKNGFEADDILYSIAKDFEKEGYQVVIITTDKDLGQAVTDSIILYDAFKLEFLDKHTIESQYGFPVEKLPFFFALCGDNSDNIPGVRGIGPKGASDLVKNFSSLHDMYAHIDDIKKERTKELLKASQQNAFLSEKLFLLTYVPLNLSEKDLAFKPDNWDYAQDFFMLYGFKSLLKHRADGLIQKETSAYKPAGDYVTVTDTALLENVVREIKAAGAFAIDTETDGAHSTTCLLVGISLCVNAGKAYYIPFDHIHPSELSKEAIFLALNPVLSSQDIKKYFHHAKFDMHALNRAGFIVKGLDFDTLVAASLLRQDNDRIGLKTLSEAYFNEPMLSFADVVTKNNYKNFSHVPLPLATEYAAADAHQTYKLVSVLQVELKEKNMHDLFYKLELPLVSLLYSMEKRGIICDKSVLDELNKQVSKDLEEITARIIDIVGPQFFAINLNSPAQLKELLFDHLKLPTSKKTTSRNSYSTDQEVLEELALIHPVPALIITYRELAKLKSTYIEGLKQWIDPLTHKIHTTFNQTQVATGRLSSSEPNLQNIPAVVADVTKLSIRSAFKAEPGQIFIAADYSQIELRVVAYLSQDPALLHAFSHNLDIHTLTASHIFDVPEREVTQEQRQLGKRINFSILYGLTPFGLSKDLHISFADAKKYIDAYFKKYSGVAAWMDRVVEKTKSLGYVETVMGRRRYISGIYEKNKTLFDAARRIAINTQGQGTAAEVMKLAMINLDRRFKAEGLTACIILQIHDELIVTAPESEKERVKETMLNVMQHSVNWNVPLLVSLSEGYTWAEVS